jgi:formate/nitrite transporter FocA (FNT family)
MMELFSVDAYSPKQIASRVQQNGVSKATAAPLQVVMLAGAFMALGFEHSVANMYFIPAGMLVSSDPDLLVSAVFAPTEQLSMMSFVWNNLIPVTLGNMLGGGLFVGLVYWFIYLRTEKGADHE